METWEKCLGTFPVGDNKFWREIMIRNTFYIAYGSNLNVLQMEHRCPMAKIYGVGRIADYRLTFKKVGAYAYATIEPCVGEYVPVAIWSITKSDEMKLDRYEGYPTHYVKKTVEVVLEDKIIEGKVYIMNPKAVYALPTQSYFECVLSGYQSFGLDIQKLYEAWFRAGGEERGYSILKYYREKKGLTQLQLAKEAGVSVKNIQKYECGERSIQRAKTCTTLRIAQALGISPYLLLN